MDYILTTGGLCKRYKKYNALTDFNMHIPKGSIYALVGRNGAGKTTLIRQICGLQEPTSGTYTLYGIKSNTKGIFKARKRIGGIVETPAVFMDMTAVENLKYQYRVLGLPSFDGIDDILELVGLSDTGNKKAKNFSLGMRQRLAIAVALCGNPDFLILDEPMNGLDPQGIIEIRELIIKLNQEKQVTILISSHILDELSRIATHYGFVEKGRMVKELGANDLLLEERKCLKLKVDNITALSSVAEAFKYEYEIFENNEVCIYGEISITRFIVALADKGCNVLSINQKSESLESYFINLVGGDENA